MAHCLRIDDAAGSWVTCIAASRLSSEFWLKPKTRTSAKKVLSPDLGAFLMPTASFSASGDAGTKDADQRLQYLLTTDKL